jgi:hypothetical protein
MGTVAVFFEGSEEQVKYVTIKKSTLLMYSFGF